MSIHEFLFRLLTLYLFLSFSFRGCLWLVALPCSVVGVSKVLNNHRVLQGWFSVRREARLSILGFLVLNLFFIGLWAAMFDS